MPTKNDNLARATDHLYNEVGIKVTAMVVSENWHAATHPLVRDYIKSLVKGDGSKPSELAPICANRINVIFMELCSKIIVGDDVLPGQLQDWYEPALAKYRSKKNQKGKRRPTPSRQLQATG